MIKIFWSNIIRHLNLPEFKKELFDAIGIETKALKDGVEFDVPTNEKFLNIPTFIVRMLDLHNQTDPIALEKIILIDRRAISDERYVDIAFDEDKDRDSIYQIAFLYNQQIRIERDSIFFTDDSIIKERLGIKSKVISDWWYTRAFIAHLSSLYDIRPIESNIELFYKNSDFLEVHKKFPYIKSHKTAYPQWNVNGDFIPSYLRHVSNDHLFELVNMRENIAPRDYRIDRISLPEDCDKIVSCLTNIGIPRVNTDTLIIPSGRYNFEHVYGYDSIRIKNTGYKLKKDHLYHLFLFLSESNSQWAFDVNKAFDKAEKNVLTILLSKRQYTDCFYKVHDAIESSLTYKACHLRGCDIFCGMVKIGELSYWPVDLISNFGLKQDYVAVNIEVTKLYRARNYNSREQILLLNQKTTEFCFQVSDSDRFFDLIHKYGVRYRTIYNGYIARDGIKINLAVYNSYVPRLNSLIDRFNLKLI